MCAPLCSEEAGDVFPNGWLLAVAPIGDGLGDSVPHVIGTGELRTGPDRGDTLATRSCCLAASLDSFGCLVGEPGWKQLVSVPKIEQCCPGIAQ